MSEDSHPRLLQTVLDCVDVRELAEFYRRLVGLRHRAGDQTPAEGIADDADWLVLTDDPDEPLSVLADPAGHPFGIFVA